mmetsp:Transcript_17736/g.32816  ORF Transcript_17736/g.32816 Transcript_17736/m.32816 type:complete len:220 (+) Transcript_17736:1137-1796(+)
MDSSKLSQKSRTKCFSASLSICFKWDSSSSESITTFRFAFLRFLDGVDDENVADSSPGRVGCCGCWLPCCLSSVDSDMSSSSSSSSSDACSFGWLSNTSSSTCSFHLTDDCRGMLLPDASNDFLAPFRKDDCRNADTGFERAFLYIGEGSLVCNAICAASTGWVCGIESFRASSFSTLDGEGCSFAGCTFPRIFDGITNLVNISFSSSSPEEEAGCCGT